MPATVQLNTRIDPELKRRGDAVFSRAGLTPSDVVRAVWRAAAQTQRVPECIEAARENPDRAAAIREGHGLACRVMRDAGVPISPTLSSYRHDDLRDEYYDDMLAAMERSHA